MTSVWYFRSISGMLFRDVAQSLSRTAGASGSIKKNVAVQIRISQVATFK